MDAAGEVGATQTGWDTSAVGRSTR